MANKNKFLAFLSRHSKKILIGAIALAGLALITMGGLWWSASRPVAVVYGKEISRKDYGVVWDQCNAQAIYDKVDVAKSRCDEAALDELILLTALRKDGADKGVTVSDAEINVEYDALVKTYKTENAMLTTYQTAFHRGKDDIKRALEVQVYKNKLKDQLLKSVDVYGVYIRWDVLSESNKMTEAAAKAKAKDALDKSFSSLFAKKTTNDQMNTAIEAFRAANPDWAREPAANFMTQTNLSATNEKKAFEGREDWAAISTLKNVGDYTKQPVVSSGGYAVIYRLDKVRSGQYASWEDYLAQVKGKSTINVQKVSLGQAYNKVASFLNYKFARLGVNVAYAQCGTNHFSEFAVYGIYVSGSTIPINGQVQVDYSSTVPSELNGYGCSLDTGGTTYLNGINSPENHLGSIGGDGKVPSSPNGLRWLSCFTTWNVHFSKSGYYPLNWDGATLGANGSHIVMDDPRNTPKMSGGDNNNRGENTNNDGYIAMTLMPSVIPTVNNDLTINKVGANGGNGTITGSAEQTKWSQPVMGYYLSNGTHFMSINPAETPPGLEGVYFYAFSSPAPNTVPIYRFNAGGAHYYSQSSATPAGYTSEGPAFHAYATTQAAGSYAVHQYYYPAANDHFYSTTTTTPNLYHDDGIAFYVPTGNTNYKIADVTTDLSCGSGCSTKDAIFVYGDKLISTTATLTATANATSTFDGWSGACSGTGTCTVTMDQARSVTATFSPKVTVIPSLSCTVTPQSGLSPLVAKVHAVATNLTAGTTYDYKMGDNSPDLLGKPVDIYYTYSAPGTYQIQIKTSNTSNDIPGHIVSTWRPCGGSGVTVTNPTDSSGGEVRP